MRKIIGSLAALALVAASPAMAQGTTPEAPAKEAKPAAKHKSTTKHAHKKTTAKPEAATPAPASK